MGKERLSYIDLGAGIMILWMIIGHAMSAASCLEITLYDLWNVTDRALIPEGVHARLGRDGHIRQTGIGYYVPYFLFFFMPWFFYKSGQFFYKQDFKIAWSKDWYKLMRQFFIWSAIGYVIHVFFLSVNGDLTLRSATYSVTRTFFLKGYIELNMPLWFLFTLFIVRQVANMILPIKGDRYYWIKCMSIIIGGYLIAFTAYCVDWDMLPLWIANGAAGLSFFTLGYFLHNYETKWCLIIPCVLIYIVCWVWGFPSVDMRANTCGSAMAYLKAFPASIAGIVAFNSICRVISKYLHYFSLPFEYIGKYAMIIYVAHGIIYISIQRGLPSFELTSLMTYNISLLLILGPYVVLLPVLCYLSNRTHHDKLGKL